MGRRSAKAVSVIPTTPLHEGGKVVHDLRMASAALAAQPYLTGYDTVGDFDAIPSSAEVVYAYIDGNMPNVDEVNARWPNAIRPTITCLDGPGQYIDCEPGNPSWTETSYYNGPDWDYIANWFQTRVDEGASFIGLYTSAAYTAAAVSELAARGWPRTRWYLDCAHWNNDPHVCGPDVCGYPEADTTQYAGSVGGFDGYDLDLSVPGLYSGNPLRGSTPTSPHPTASEEDDDMRNPVMIQATGAAYEDVSEGEMFVVHGGHRSPATQAAVNWLCQIYGQKVPFVYGTGADEVKPPAEFTPECEIIAGIPQTPS